MAIGEMNKPEGPLTWVFDETALGQLIEAIISAEDVVVDLETTGLQERAWEGGWQNGGVGARISLASFTLPQLNSFGAWDGELPTTWVLPLSHPESPFRGTWRRVLARVMQAAVDFKKPISNQNVKFDARWMMACVGVDISANISWDTKDGWHALDNSKSTKLKERVPIEFGVPPWNDFEFTVPGASERVPLFELGLYAARDTWWTWKGKRKQLDDMFLGEEVDEPITKEDVTNAKIGRLATWTVMPIVASLTKLEQRGFRLDVDWVNRELEEQSAIAKQGLEEMADRYGFEKKGSSIAPTSHWFLNWMDHAVEIDEIRVGAVTATGKSSWGKNVLTRQERAGSPAAALVLRTRRASKKAEFLRSWLYAATPEGFVYASYNSGSVATGRLSSSGPNMQQVTKSLRPAFIPRDGFVIADLDYSQIEMRVAAFISRSEPMIRAFQDGKDTHRMLAATIVNKQRMKDGLPPIGPDDVTPDDRQKGKSANFGLLYEMGAFGFQQYAENAYGVILTMEEAVEIREAFFSMWVGMREWHANVKKRVHADGYIASPIGRIRHLPGIWSQNEKMVSYSERAAINSPVQGLASDLMQMALASIQGFLPEQAGLPAIPNAFPVATVHDSIVVELPEDNWEEVVEACAERMRNLDTVLAKLGVEFDVPLVADYAVGTRWSLHDVSDPDTIDEPVLDFEPDFDEA